MGFRVLVVDDEEAILFALAEYMTLRGCSADRAQTLHEAKELLSRNPYDVVVADLRLTATHKHGGFEVASEAKRRSPATRTIILTAYKSPEVDSEARRFGVDRVLSKPLPLEEVTQAVLDLAQGAQC